MKSKSNIAIAKKILEYRERYGMSQRAFSLHVGMAQGSVSRIEAYYAKSIPSIDTLRAITTNTDIKFEITIENGKIEVK